LAGSIAAIAATSARTAGSALVAGLTGIDAGGARTSCTAVGTSATCATQPL
jgi:hypothetical protein